MPDGPPAYATDAQTPAPTPYDDEQFRELYCGEINFSITHTGRSQSYADIMANQHADSVQVLTSEHGVFIPPPYTLRLTKAKEGTLVLWVNKSAVKAAGSCSAVRAMVKKTIASMHGGEGVEVFAAVPADGKDEFHLRPYNLLLLNVPTELGEYLMSRNFHTFAPTADVPIPITLSTTTLPYSVPVFTGIWTGVEGVEPAVFKKQLAEACLASPETLSALTHTTTDPASLIAGAYTARGLIENIITHSVIRRITHVDRYNSRITDLLVLYLLPLTTKHDAARHAQRCVAKLSFHIRGVGKASPWMRNVSCSECYECDHYDHDCAMSNNEHFVLLHRANDHTKNANVAHYSSDLLPTAFVALTQSPSSSSYRGAGRGLCNNFRGRGVYRGRPF
jgi:hypothetical protein